MFQLLLIYFFPIESHNAESAEIDTIFETLIWKL